MQINIFNEIIEIINCSKRELDKILLKLLQKQFYFLFNNLYILYYLNICDFSSF